MDELIKTMRYADIWCKNDLSKILATYNPSVGDEAFFKNLIYCAQEANIIRPTSIPHIVKAGSFSHGTDLKQYNYQYSRESLISWILSKNNWKLPNEFDIQNSTNTLEQRSEKAYLTIIGALLHFIEGATPTIPPHPSFTNETALIEILETQYTGFYGMSSRNLSGKFPLAHKAIR